jgi:hypothetical protein
VSKSNVSKEANLFCRRDLAVTKREPLTPGLDVSMDAQEFVGLSKRKCFCPNWRVLGKGRHASIYDKALPKRTMGAHCVVYRLLIGPIDGWPWADTPNVLHRCGNGDCINPYHLYLGTHMQNARDRRLHRDSRTESKGQKFEEIRETKGIPGKLAPLKVFKPDPVALSEELSMDIKKFVGFSRRKCFCANWPAPSRHGGSAHLGDQSLPQGIEGARLLVYMALVGPISDLVRQDTDMVLNRCGNADCINPYHLYQARPAQNHRAARYGRDRRYKLSSQQIEEIRASTKSYRELAREYGVHYQTIMNIKRGVQS